MLAGKAYNTLQAVKEIKKYIQSTYKYLSRSPEAESKQSKRCNTWVIILLSQNTKITNMWLVEETARSFIGLIKPNSSDRAVKQTHSNAQAT